jgi:hypothetical protein
MHWDHNERCRTLVISNEVLQNIKKTVDNSLETTTILNKSDDEMPCNNFMDSNENDERLYDNSENDMDLLSQYL